MVIDANPKIRGRSKPLDFGPPKRPRRPNYNLTTPLKLKAKSNLRNTDKSGCLEMTTLIFIRIIIDINSLFVLLCIQSGLAGWDAVYSVGIVVSWFRVLGLGKGNILHGK